MVLIVEDEDSLRIAVSKMLHKKGFSVMEAQSGRLGIDLFREYAKEIDVVLLDLTLPDITAREIFEEIRRLRPDLKVILTTAHSRGHALGLLGGQESWSYVQKPFQLPELIELIRGSAQSQ